MPAWDGWNASSSASYFRETAEEITVDFVSKEEVIDEAIALAHWRPHWDHRFFAGFADGSRRRLFIVQLFFEQTVGRQRRF